MEDESRADPAAGHGGGRSAGAHPKSPAWRRPRRHPGARPATDLRSGSVHSPALARRGHRDRQRIRPRPGPCAATQPPDSLTKRSRRASGTSRPKAALSRRGTGRRPFRRRWPRALPGRRATPRSGSSHRRRSGPACLDGGPSERGNWVPVIHRDPGQPGREEIGRRGQHLAQGCGHGEATSLVGQEPAVIGSSRLAVVGPTLSRW